jgi:hypothetical protein
MEVISLLQRKLLSRPYLHELLAGSTLAPPEGPPPKKKDPAYQVRVSTLAASVENEFPENPEP